MKNKIAELEHYVSLTYHKMINATDKNDRYAKMVEHYKAVSNLDQELEIQSFFAEDKARREKSLKRKAGFTLLEVIVATMIMGIMSMGTLGLVRILTKTIKKAEAVTQVVQPTQPADLLTQVQTKWNWVNLPSILECKKADKQYWVKRTADRTVTLYTNQNCTSGFGTLNALDNSPMP